MAQHKDDLIVDGMSECIVRTAEAIATTDGVANITVRKILQQLSITNRVFYNRFHNIDEVLEVVYMNTVLKIRESVKKGIDPKRDFFEQIMEIVESTLLMSYDTKMKFNHYVFLNDSQSSGNYEWWMAEIKKLIEYAREHHYIKAVDTELISYSIWCFIRGFNADAVGRKLPRAEAVRKFRYGFGILLDGLKK